jgi:hypothetical protein
MSQFTLPIRLRVSCVKKTCLVDFWHRPLSSKNELCDLISGRHACKHQATILAYFLFICGINQNVFSYAGLIKQKKKPTEERVRVNESQNSKLGFIKVLKQFPKKLCTTETEETRSYIIIPASAKARLAQDIITGKSPAVKNFFKR